MRMKASGAGGGGRPMKEGAVAPSAACHRTGASCPSASTGSDAVAEGAHARELEVELVELADEGGREDGPAAVVVVVAGKRVAPF